MVKLQWLQINRFRSVKPGTRLTFNPGYNVLLGQNGTGKTTLLNLVAAVVRSDFTGFRDIDFDLQYSLTSETSTAIISVRNELRNAGPQHALDLPRPRRPRRESPPFDLNRPETILTTETRLESKVLGTALIETQGSSGMIRVIANAGESTPTRFEPVAQYDLSRMLGGALWDVHHQFPSLMELYEAFTEHHLQRFDESLEYFAQLTNREVSIFRFSQDDFHVQPPMPEGFHEALLALVRQRWGSHQYVISHEQLPFLRDVVQLLGFKSAEAIIELQESSDDDVADWMNLGNLRFLFTHPGGWTISEKLLSYGQKRMLAFLYYLATVPSVAVADELVNGLHHRWIHAAIESLGQRQVFLTSQNPLLLDYLAFESPEQVRSTFILCRWEGEGAQARMIWENMSQEAAGDFFDSYKVGFQQVGELLQAKGLW